MRFIVTTDQIELGRIIRGQTEEIWAFVLGDGCADSIRYEAHQMGGGAQHVRYLTLTSFYASQAPRAIKELCKLYA
jgi:hypothetical protein